MPLGGDEHIPVFPLSVPDVAGRDVLPAPPTAYVPTHELDADHYDFTVSNASMTACRRCGAAVPQVRVALDQHDRFHRLLAYIDRDSRLGTTR